MNPTATTPPIVWTLADAASIATILASIAVIGALLVAAIQLLHVGSASKIDSRRFRRESTRFIFDAIQNDKFRSSRRVMFQALNRGDSVPNARKEIDGFRAVLNTYEMLAMAVLLDAVDEEVWRRYWRKTLIRDWDRLTQFAEHERERFDHPKLYEDTETIVMRWRKK